METTSETVEQSPLVGLVNHLPVFVSILLLIGIEAITLYTIFLIAQICGAHPTVTGATTEVVLSASSNGSYTVNTTVTFKCPDNSSMTSTCSYVPVGGAQWVGELRQACPTVVGKNIGKM